MTKLSIIIPSYNHADYIVAAIESCENQTFKDFEVVIIDDGSTDDSWIRIKDYVARSHLKIISITQANAGAHAAISAGIELASGEHIAVLNSDDVYHPDRFEMMMSRVPRSSPYIAFSEIEYIDHTGKVIEGEFANRTWYRELLAENSYTPGVGFAILIGNFTVSTSNFLFSRSIYDMVNGFAPYQTAHDLDFILRCCELVEPVFVRHVLLNYRVHNRNTISTSRELERAEVASIFTAYVSRIAKVSPSNDLAPGSTSLQLYSDYFFNARPFWFSPDRTAPAFQQFQKLSHDYKNEDAKAMRMEVERLNTVLLCFQESIKDVKIAGAAKDIRLAKLEGELLETERRVSKALDELSRLQTSTSWRITRPLRNLKALLRR